MQAIRGFQAEVYTDLIFLKGHPNHCMENALQRYNGGSKEASQEAIATALIQAIDNGGTDQDGDGDDEKWSDLKVDLLLNWISCIRERVEFWA